MKKLLKFEGQFDLDGRGQGHKVFRTVQDL